jgi:rSAM/selenodomain-associated transferase 2
VRERALISIIIPTLNEEAVLPGTLDALHGQASPFEILVVDGHSTDNTRECARKAGATVLSASRGRASQMNRGAQAAQGDIYLFLHADTLLSPDGLAIIRRTLADPEATAGTFRLQFDEPTPLLRFYGLCTRWPWIRLCFGDRGLFVDRSAFEAVGGYPDWPLFEDLELAARLHDDGDFRFLNTPVTTSARRFQRNGVLTQQLRNLYLWLHYVCGADPERVAHLYRYQETTHSSQGADASPKQSAAETSN